MNGVHQNPETLLAIAIEPRDTCDIGSCSSGSCSSGTLAPGSVGTGTRTHTKSGLPEPGLPEAAEPSLPEAVERLCATLRPTPLDTVPLRAALGRCLAEPLHAPNPFPPFDRAMMDGYALRAAEVQPGAVWIVDHSLTAGQAATAPLHPGHAVRIATGAPLPPGADTVLRQEWAQCLGQTLRAALPHIAPGKDAERQGHGTATGALLLPAHQPLSPVQLAHAARHGIAQLTIHRPARLALILIGNELTEAGQPLPPGQLYEHNSIFLDAALDETRLGEISHRHTVRDDPDAMDAALHTARAQAPDMLLLVGGTSVGTQDFTRSVLRRHGELLFEGINTRPGRTGFAGITPDGRPLIALPGSPKAVHALWAGLLHPALRRMNGYRAAR